MKWTQTKNVIYLKDYPFFNTIIFVRKNRDKTLTYYETQHPYKKYETLDLAKQGIIDSILTKKEVSSYEEIKWEMPISIGYPNNVGNGYYITCETNYNWVFGCFQPWRSPSNSYAIRFNIDTTQEELEKYAIRIYNKHLKRFKKCF